MQAHIKIRLESRGKDGTEGFHNCERCGQNNGCDVHHIVSRRYQGTDDKYNLIMLCRQCHSLAHSFNSIKMKDGLRSRVKDLID